jgi:beta-phosphoglucomutase-like phosphatase (HAD superfamily)
MPKLIKIPTDEEQQEWEENVLYPQMYRGVIDDIKRMTIETKKISERTAKRRAERLAREASQPKQKKENKDKTKIIEDVKEMIKNTESKKKKKHSSDINVT